jgi:hypothetical protein
LVSSRTPVSRRTKRQERPREITTAFLEDHLAAGSREANDGIAIVAGVEIYLAFVSWLHLSLIGIPVI